MDHPPLRDAQKILLTVCLALLLLGSCFEFFDIAWGTGIWLGELAPSWALFFALYVILCLVFLTTLVFILRHDRVHTVLTGRLISLRERLGFFRWLLAAVIFISPVVLLQLTEWGVAFQGPFIRSLLWLAVLLSISILASQGPRLIGWPEFLVTLVSTAALFSMAASLRFVTAYPFSLGWSEGNRLWDYSIMFGRERYEYPADREIFVLLEEGRQFVGAVPFLMPGISIEAVRAWVSLMTILPYAALGLVAFRSFHAEKRLWFMLALATYLFLKQGPIHPPLVICAVLIAAAWRSSLWLAVPLLMLSGYFAGISRYTWVFAPAAWIAILEFSGAPTRKDGSLPAGIWLRAGILFCSGLSGSLLLPYLVDLIKTGSLSDFNVASVMNGLAVSPENIQANVSRQPLLWYRLFPNPTYGNGILVGLLLAVVPLIVLLFYLARKGGRVMNVWQKLAIILPLLAFLGVGVVVSTKIGGGGDLHNMDMFLIGLFFSAVIALHNTEWRSLLLAEHTEPGWLRGVVVLILVIPALGALQEMRSYSFGHDVTRLAALTDAVNERALEMYPSDKIVDDSLRSIQHEAKLALSEGAVLFLDQRQLLTFGFITGVPLVPEYDKKVLMEQALASNRAYFEGFYRDLQEGRFLLIITQPLSTPKKGSDYQFGEENNAWVRWVANPLLCYYRVKQTFPEVNVQLLVPRPEAADCSKELP